MATTHSPGTVTEDRIAEYDDDLDLRLTKVGRLLDVPSIINESQEKPYIVNYFEKTKTLYRIVHSWEGYLHFGISYDGKHKRRDYKEQARIVEKYIRDSDAKNVLELAYGMGTNMAFLARRNPDVTFDGVDLSHKPLKRYTKIPNAHFQLGDYHDLSAFEDDAYDIAFVVEALCYSANKLQVLREVKKKLKRDGLFIVIDGYQNNRATPLSPSESMMWKLIESGFVLKKLECIKDVEGYMLEGYSIVAAQDVTQYVLPSMLNHERKGKDAFNHPMFGGIFKKLWPFEFVKNIMVVYLLPTSIRRQIFCYYIHVLKNDK
jgi:ubiquinone/menaquinone biosynthesis C-methylase UbiE